MPVQRKHPSSISDYLYTFFNVSEVAIKSITINSISIALEGKNSKLSAFDSDFYGFLSPSESVININGAQTLLLDNCKFQQNVFLRLHSKADALIKTSTFSSYNHKQYPVLQAHDSTLTLTGTVNFTDNVNSHYGAAIIAQRTLIVFSGGSRACVYFKNNTGSEGGAIYIGDESVMEVGENTTVMLTNNKAKTGGGAIKMWKSIINISRNAAMHFINNSAAYSGALKAVINSQVLINHGTLNVSNNLAFLMTGGFRIGFNSTLRISNQAFVAFSNNTSKRYGGGAMQASYSKLVVSNSVLLFNNNNALRGNGGAIHLLNSIIKIEQHTNFSFTNNAASDGGGAIFECSECHLQSDTNSFVLFRNNSAFQGGALYTSTTSFLILGIQSVIKFTNNTATDRGGALYASIEESSCIFCLTQNPTQSIVHFEENKAISGIGTQIYGGSIRSITCTYTALMIDSNFKQTAPYCGKESHNNIKLITNQKDSFSQVSSDPERVCLCDNHQPMCTNLSQIFASEIKVIPGETIQIPAVVVGQDFGVTAGYVYANLIQDDMIHHNTQSSHQHRKQQWIPAKCSTFNYTVHTMKERVILYLHTTTRPVENYGNQEKIQNSISNYNSSPKSCVTLDILETPVYINITLLRCPKGFIFQKQQQGCNCYSALLSNQFNCYLTHNKGYIQWNSTMWVGESNFNRRSDGILLSPYCPQNFCKSGKKNVSFDIDPDAQCALNHAGVLCGGCRDNYSLAIGSSRCISCSTNSYLALFLFFVMAGLLLVSFIFLANLTVSKGLLNGLVFYTNVVWAYKIALSLNLQQQNIMQVFIAWLNLDLGIETCLIAGLNAYWKTWLQFAFPLYIWIIAGGIIVACRYSYHLTNLIGDRAVPLLATLFYLSYMKLLRTVVTVFEFSIVTHYPGGSKDIVWTLDGNLSYCQHPHIYLFITSLTVLVFIFIPFTFFLLMIKCWMKVSNLRPLRWINKFTPVYDACFAPLNDSHCHIFGTYLLIRALLLAVVTLTSNSATQRTTNLLVLFVTSAMLLLYVLFSRNVYKSHLVKILESISLVNLIFLSFLSLYATHKETIILEVSVGFAFVQFCIIVLVSLVNTAKLSASVQ